MFTHIVKPGESLWSIVSLYRLFPVDLAIQKVLNQNKLQGVAYIYPGQSLVIPVHGLNYVVKPGDTFWLLSRRFGVPLHQLAVYNKISVSSILHIGMIIRFPAVACIDPGHQLHPDFGVEPIGPGSSEMKQKVSAGAQGVATGKPEFELNLEVSLKIRDLLLAKGYYVVMTRTRNDVNLSNVQRAQIGNNANADLCVRIHADSSTDPLVNGISVLYPSPASPFTSSDKFHRSIRAAQLILDAIIHSTDANSKGIVPRTDLTGFNWSIIPVVLVEMGFLSNPAEDVRMSTPAYQEKLARGIVNGIDRYFI